MKINYMLLLIISPIAFTLSILFIQFISSHANARGDLSGQKPVNIEVFLGNRLNPHRFIPATLRFETGKLYRLKLVNASKTKHYFTSNRFAASVYTRKVQMVNKDGMILAEVKGAISTIEVYPGQVAEWWFVPIKSGVINDLHCEISGHAEAGMIGKIIIN